MDGGGPKGLIFLGIFICFGIFAVVVIATQMNSSSGDSNGDTSSGGSSSDDTTSGGSNSDDTSGGSSSDDTSGGSSGGGSSGGGSSGGGSDNWILGNLGESCDTVCSSNFTPQEVQGVFTDYSLSTIQSLDINNDGVISISELTGFPQGSIDTLIANNSCVDGDWGVDSVADFQEAMLAAGKTQAEIDTMCPSYNTADQRSYHPSLNATDCRTGTRWESSTCAGIGDPSFQRLCNCRGGAVFERIIEGTCETPITTEEECSAAAAEHRLEINANSGNDNPAFPSGCSVIFPQQINQVYFNPGQSTAQCGVSNASVREDVSHCLCSSNT